MFGCFRFLAAIPGFFISSLILMLLWGVIAPQVGLKTINYAQAMLVTITIWLGGGAVICRRCTSGVVYQTMAITITTLSAAEGSPSLLSRDGDSSSAGGGLRTSGTLTQFFT